MLKFNLTRYKNYVINFHRNRSLTPFPRYVNGMKFFYKKLYINSFYLIRHNLSFYKKPKKMKKFFFMSQTKLNLIKKPKIKNKKVFYLTHVSTYFKSDYIKSRHYDFYTLLISNFHFFYFKNFRYYWLSAFFKPFIKTRFFWFTNYIKFFKNQRLVKQPVLVMYNITNKNNTYSNYLRYFKSFVFKKNNNSLFFLRSVLFQIYPKFNSKSYFFRHNIYIRRFVNTNYLKITAYIAQW